MLIHPSAVVDSRAELDASVEVGAYAVIEGPARIGPGTRVFPHAYITGWTDIGRGCQIHPFSVVGGAPQDLAYAGAESYCRIGDETIVREHATIHRGTAAGSETIVGKRCFIMANAHVGHNCRIGDDVKLVNAVLLAGHVQIENNAFIGGGAVIHQFCRIGELAMLGGLAGIGMDVPPYFMAVHFGECAGINSVGIKRAGFSSAERQEIREAYRLLYRSDMLFRDAVAQVADTMKTPPGRKLAEFLTAPSKRGILPPPRFTRSGGRREQDSSGTE